MKTQVRERARTDTLISAPTDEQEAPTTAPSAGKAEEKQPSLSWWAPVVWSLVISIASSIILVRLTMFDAGHLIFEHNQIYVLFWLLIAAEIILLLSRFKTLLFLICTFLVSVMSIFFYTELSIQITLVVLMLVGGIATGHIILLNGAVLVHAIWMVMMYDFLLPYSESMRTADYLLLATLLLWIVLLTIVECVIMVYSRQTETSDKRIRYCESTIRQLSDANIGYSSFAQHARIRALNEERNRITHEIHDDVGYTLTNIIMLSETCLASIESGGVPDKDAVYAIRHQAKTGLFETRRALKLLRQTEEKMPRGMDSIRELLKVYEKSTGISTELTILVQEAKLAEVSLFLAVYRFVQESLTNSFRHGKATHISVRFFEHQNWLYVTVSDNGRGSDTVSEGIGIQGMRERVGSLGGSISYAQHTGGFTISAQMPLRCF